MNSKAVSALALILASATIVATAQVDSVSTRFEALIERYVKERSGGGADLSVGAIQKRVEGQKAQRSEFAAIPADPLSSEQRIDRLAVLGQLDGSIYELETIRSWERNPEQYVQLTSVAGAMSDESTPADKRAARVIERLQAATKSFAEARANLKQPPKRFTEGAIYQATEWLEFLKKDVIAFAAGAGDARASVEKAAIETAAALESFVSFLKTDLLPRSTGNEAIGRDAYAYLLQQRWLMRDDPEAILARGRKAFEDTERLAQEVANRMAPGKPWVEVYEQLTLNHPAADRLKEEYQAQMDAAQAYLKAHEIVTLPEGERVITVDTPPPMRRSSPFGTFSSASPFGTSLLGRLVLTPVEDHLTPEQREERLRSHHRAWIPIIAVHEAYPGHHVQALKARENPRVLRKVVRESIFSEGWGLFTEEMMYEEGFLKGDAVRLTQLRNRLWRAARVIIDVGIHTGTMTFDEGVQLLVDKVRFERYAAELEVGMYTRRPTMVLGYLIGMQEIQSMREAYYAKFGKPAKPRELYDKLLRIGALPPSLVRAELLGEPIATR